MNISRKWFWFLGFFLLLATPLRADQISAQMTKMIQDLQGQMAELKGIVVKQQEVINNQSKELESLKLKVEPRTQASSGVYIPSPEAQTALPKWIEGMKMGGDLRLRYESFNKHITRDRNRMRFRLRYGIEKELNEDFAVVFRLASGSANDPTSTNQTFTGDFTAKSIFIDRAYALYHPKAVKEHVPHLKNFEIGGGKLPNPFLETTTGYIMDSDVNPEGLTETVEFSFMEDRFRPFGIFGQYPFNENTTASSDAELYAWQAGWRAELSDDPKNNPMTWTHALGFFDFSDAAHDSNFVVSGTSLARGNTTRGSTDLAAGDFNIFQIYEDLKFKVGKVPVKLFGEYDWNAADSTPSPDDANMGYQTGIALGAAKKQGDWLSSLYYGYIESNAVLGALSESDFGEGHANEKGLNLETNYMLTDFLKLRLKASHTQRISGPQDETGRFQADLDWKF